MSSAKEISDALAQMTSEQINEACSTLSFQQMYGLLYYYQRNHMYNELRYFEQYYNEVPNDDQSAPNVALRFFFERIYNRSRTNGKTDPELDRLADSIGNMQL